MGEVREENERLRMMLQRIEKDYKTLQLRFFDINNRDDHHRHVEETEEPELVSLSLGRTSPRESKKDENSSTSLSKNNVGDDENEDLQANLTLGLGTRMQLPTQVIGSDPSPENSSEDHLKEAAGDAWQPSNKTSSASKTMRNNGDDDINSQQAHAKRARVSVRARCDTPTVSTLHDQFK